MGTGRYIVTSPLGKLKVVRVWEHSLASKQKAVSSKQGRWGKQEAAPLTGGEGAERVLRRIRKALGC
jgi:hypothetical protein